MHRFSALAVLVLCTKASAQAFNVDLAGSIGTPPPDSYGAAAGQKGYWNPVGLDGPLADTSGNATGAEYFFNGGGGSNVTIPGAEGGDKFMMESRLSAPINQNSLGLLNLEPGSYDLYVYAWGGNDEGVTIQVSNAFTTWSQFVNNNPGWPGGQVEGGTYARLRVEVLPINRGLGITFLFGSGDVRYVNGLQLVPVPSPGCAALLPVGWLSLRGRRR